MPCDHDILHPIRKGRAWYVCSLCGDDISLLIFLFESMKYDQTTKEISEEAQHVEE